MTKPIVSFKNVKKKFSGSTKNALQNVSFDIFEGEFVAILGASGSGKTTTLKMINRLIEPDAGEIEIRGKAIDTIDAIELRRKIGYVVQQVGLFPHYTIEKNISTVPELLSWDKKIITARVKELMHTIELPYNEYANRYPRQLSGGQQQRVGVARSLAANPTILLMDEPFGAVDAITKNNLQLQIKKLHQNLKNKAFLLVTHDIKEAFYLGTKVMIMQEGKVVQFDKPEVIIQTPRTDYVKELLNTVYMEDEMWRMDR